MHEVGNTHDKPYRKSSRPVADTMGKYHPHGDSAIYDALVRMTQDFSMSLPLLDGQGNFGSMDGDPPAAFRYTEVRLEKAALSLLDDIDKTPSIFRTTTTARTANPLFCQQNTQHAGQRVGRHRRRHGHRIPPHNLGEVIDGTLAMIETPISPMGIAMEIIPAPDFPTGGMILGRSGARKAYLEAAAASSSAPRPMSKRSARTAGRHRSMKSPIR